MKFNSNLLLFASVLGSLPVLWAHTAVGLRHINYFGRFDTQSTAFPRADWSGTGIYFAVETDNNAVDITLSFSVEECVNDCNYFLDVALDCQHSSVIQVNASATTYEVSFPAPSTRFEVALTKRTEVSCVDAVGIMSFSAVSITNGGSIVRMNTKESCRDHELKMLVVGDSLTAAYGVEGVSPCKFTADTENVLLDYSTLVAHEIGASLHTVAWSGKGAVRNYGDNETTSTDPMPVYYNRTIGAVPATEATVWDPAAYQPHIVVVMLGSNDYSTEPHPADSDFIAALADLLMRIQADYPSASLLALCAPDNHGPQCENIAAAATAASEAKPSQPVQYFGFPSETVVGYGCDYHPNAASHRNMADSVLPVVQSMI